LASLPFFLVRLLACLLPSTIAGLFACRSKKSGGNMMRKEKLWIFYIDVSKIKNNFRETFFQL
jgi:hypothetical protein